MSDNHYEYILGVSWGNDSVALVQHVYDFGLRNVVCLYNDTGWSMPTLEGIESWLDRVLRLETWAQSLGFKTARTESIGMEALVHERRGWPRQGIQFCTEILKMKPTQDWLDIHDPNKSSICVNGKRRAESKIRSEIPEWVESSLAHGGRKLWQPLYAHSDEDRDALLARTGEPKLLHKSWECMVCVNANRKDLLEAPEIAIAKIEQIERDLGVGVRSGKPKTMFRPKAKMGATGIREVIRWAQAGHGKYTPLDENLMDDGTGPSESSTGCDGGFCGT